MNQLSCNLQHHSFQTKQTKIAGNSQFVQRVEPDNKRVSCSYSNFVRKRLKRENNFPMERSQLYLALFSARRSVTVRIRSQVNYCRMTSITLTDIATELVITRLQALVMGLTWIAWKINVLINFKICALLLLILRQ